MAAREIDSAGAASVLPCQPSRARKNPSLKSFALVALLSLLWGTSFPFMKIAVETLPPLTMAAARSLIAGLLLLAVLGPRARELWTAAVPPRDYLLQAAFNCVLPWILVTWAATKIDSALTTILTSISPIFVFLFTWLVTRHEALNGRKLTGVVLGMAGVVAIVGPGAARGFGEHTLAELACVGGSLCYAISILLGRRFAGVSPLLPATASTLIAAAVLIPLALVVEAPWTVQPSARSLWGLLGSAVFATAAAFILYFRLVATLGAVATSAQAYLRIVVGVGIGVTLLGERLTAGHVIGMALAFAGVLSMTLPGRR